MVACSFFIASFLHQGALPARALARSEAARFQGLFYHLPHSQLSQRVTPHGTRLPTEKWSGQPGLACGSLRCGRDHPSTPLNSGEFSEIYTSLYMNVTGVRSGGPSQGVTLLRVL